MFRVSTYFLCVYLVPSVCQVGWALVAMGMMGKSTRVVEPHRQALE